MTGEIVRGSRIAVGREAVNETDPELRFSGSYHKIPEYHNRQTPTDQPSGEPGRSKDR